MTRPVVLNTRPREQAAELSRLLRAAGYTPLEAPAVETAPAWDPRELQKVLSRLRASGYAWVVFSSRNAVRFFLAGLSEVGGSTADLGEVKVLAGTGTAEALVGAGVPVACALERFSAEAALALLRTELERGQRVLAPRAAEGRDELVNGLPDVDAPVCYRTQPVAPASLAEAADRLRAGEVEAVIFASPSAVQSVVGALGAPLLRRPAIVCLGATTAHAARAAGVQADGVAEQTDLPSLVEAVGAAVGARQVRV